MRNLNEIRRDLSAKIEATKAIDAKADAQGLETALAEIDALSRELEAANKIEAAEQKAAESRLDNLQKSAGRQFSFVKFFRELGNGQALTGLEAEVCKMGAEEYDRLGLTRKGYVIPSAVLRSGPAGQNAGTDADGGYMKEQAPCRYVDGLKDRLVVASLGATVLGDLVGTVPVVSAAEISAAWKAEGATASVSKSTISKYSLTPHRNAVVGAFSKDLLKQTSLDVEAIIMDKVLSAHATLIDAAAIAGTGTSNQPSGILKSGNCTVVAIDTNGGPITWAKVVELETKVNALNANRGKMAYLTNAKVMGALKTTERYQGNGRYLLDGDFKAINGYPIDWSNLVPANLTKGTTSGTCCAMIFGNFEDLYIGHWGGVDIVVDPYTLAADGDVRIVLNSWDDAVVVQPSSFAAIMDITV